MLAVVLAAIVTIVAIVAVARLVTVVRNDRPLTAPRSHPHELDPRAARLSRAV